MVKIADVKVRGQSFPVHVTDEGKFFAKLDGDQISAVSLDELRSKLARATLRRNKKISIPFVTWDNGKIRRGAVTGEHAINKNVLVKWDGGKSEQMSSWRSETYIDPKVETEYVQLCEALDAARKALDTFETKHTVEVGKLLAEAYESEETEAGGAA